MCTPVLVFMCVCARARVCYLVCSIGRLNLVGACHARVRIYARLREHTQHESLKILKPSDRVNGRQ